MKEGYLESDFTVKENAATKSLKKGGGVL